MIPLGKLLDRIFYKKGIPDLNAKHLFNFRRIWILLFSFTALVAIVPLLFFAYINYQVTQASIKSEASLNINRLSNNLWSFVSLFIDERKLALDFITKDNTYEELTDPERLKDVLLNLQNSFGGVTDLGIINKNGKQVTYAGPYKLQGKDYSQSSSFEQTIRHEFNISDLFLGYRNEPHLAMSIKRPLPDGSFYILRATIEDKFINIIKHLKIKKSTDAFILNDKGLLQTPSRFFGDALNKVPFKVPKKNDSLKSFEYEHDKQSYIISYQNLHDTPFTIVVMQNNDYFVESWENAKIRLIEYLIISIAIVLLSIYAVMTYIIKKLKIVDKRRIRNLHMAEQASRMASVGKLAAGVAHEINNPLAIINERAGYIQDMFTILEHYQKDEKLQTMIDSIIKNVERCGRITKRLLRFSRQDEIQLAEINMQDMIYELLDFVKKEADFRNIKFTVEIPNNFPIIYSDKGKLEQVFLNLINNGIDAMKKGGELRISSGSESEERVTISISDSGIGIPQEDLEKIFEPFYTTKPAHEGTGLGLSICYSIISELGGKILVRSKEGVGTTFTVNLPVSIPKIKK